MAKFKLLEAPIFKHLFRRDPSYGGQFPSNLNGVNGGSHIRYEDYIGFLNLEYDRKLAYKDYEEMDTDTVAAVLDLWADDATQMNLKDGESFYINCVDAEVKEILETLFFKTLHMEEHIWTLVRTFAKLGDAIVRPHCVDGQGIIYCDYSIHPERVTRLDEGGAIRKFIVDEAVELNPWDLVHFRMPGASPFLRRELTQFATTREELNSTVNLNTYGRSCLDKARKTWKQRNLLEDSLILSRLSRAFKRNIFMVNTTGLGETAAWDLVDRVSELLKSNRTVNTGTAMNSYSNLMHPEEDIILPVTGEKGQVTVQELGGDVEIQHIADVDYVNNKLFSDLKTPKAYVGFEEGLNGRNTLRMLDVRYARTIKNLQRVLIIGLERLARIHLSMMGRDPYGVEFSITLPYVSTIEEVEQAEIISTTMDTISKISDMLNNLDSDNKIIDKQALAEYMLREAHIPDEVIDKLLKKTAGSDGSDITY